MKPFDLEKALKHPELVRTRDGRRIKKLVDTGFECAYPIVALIEDYEDNACLYTREGRFCKLGTEMGVDLFMIEENVTFYVNFYRNSLGDLFAGDLSKTENEAKMMASESTEIVAKKFTYEVE